MGSRTEIPPGSLYLLILKILQRGALHGYGIAQRIEEMSGEVFRVEEGSLYPALQRMLLKGWVTAEWGVTDTNRRARFYKITALGRKQLGIELSEFQRAWGAIHRVIQEA